MASPVIASSTTLEDPSNTTSRNITKPSGTASGDWLLYIGCIDGSNTGTFTLATFTEVFLFSNTTHYLAVYARLADGSEGASFAVGTSSEQGQHVMLRITGSSATTVADFVNQLSSGRYVGKTYAPSLAGYATTPDTLVLRVCGADGSFTPTITDPGSHTSVYNSAASGTASVSLSVCRVDKAASGYINTAAFTLSAAEECATLTLAIASGTTEDSLTQPIIKGVHFFQPDTGVAFVYPVPWGTEDGDTLFLMQGSDANVMTAPGSISPAFTTIDSTSNTAVWGYTAYRIASGESGSYTTSSTSASSKGGYLALIKNADASSPINQNTVATGTDAAPTASTLTPGVNNCLVITGFVADDDDITEGSGFTSTWTEIIALENLEGGDYSILSQYKAQTTATSTGAVAMGMDAAEEWIAFNVAIKPAAAAAPVVAGPMQDLMHGLTANYGGQGFIDPTLHKIDTGVNC